MRILLAALALLVGTVTKARPQDLGYFIGYRIAESYYRRATDKRQALRDMLLATDYRAFWKSSVYDP